MGIITSGTLWATAIDYLNNYEELTTCPPSSLRDAHFAPRLIRVLSGSAQARVELCVVVTKLIGGCVTRKVR